MCYRFHVMPTSKPKKKTIPEAVEPPTPAKTGKRLMHWLAAPGNVCLPVEDQQVFTDSPQWKVFRIMAEFVEGYEFLSHLHNEVSIFGSARAMPGDPYYKAARELGKQLGQKGYTVITGGGPGIMEAGNRGASEANGQSVGLNIQLPIEQRTNRYVKKGMGFHYFFTRKVMLSASSQAYVFFPGGFGTLDEMTEMATLAQTGKIPSDVPIILFGKDFWSPLLDWIKQYIIKKQRYLEPEEMSGIIHLVDSVDEAMAIINSTMERSFG